jgi:hypothetical protein
VLNFAVHAGAVHCSFFPLTQVVKMVAIIDEAAAFTSTAQADVSHNRPVLLCGLFPFLRS